MSATYNWAYRPGVSNKYNLGIDNTGNDVRPNNVAYVALFGNDLTGNGSRLYPYRTINHAAGISHTMIVGSGVYREVLNDQYVIYGDGDVIIDGTLLAGHSVGSFYNVSYKNCYNAFGTFKKGMQDIVIDQGANLFGNNGADYNIWSNSIYSNLDNAMICGGNSLLSGGGSNTNNTFYKITYLHLYNNYNTGLWSQINYIFSDCDIWIDGQTLISYSLFWNCRFYIGNNYPSNSDFISITDIATLRAAHSAVYSATTVANNFANCTFGDPQFNNPTIGDFTLATTSPAKNMSYFGSYIGARSIGTPIKASATGTTGFDTDSLVNLNIGEDSITLIDTTQNAQVDSAVIANLVQREIAKFPSYGFNADRNGQYIDSIADLDTVTIAAGGTVSYPASYIVEGAAIDYNSNPYQPGERFTTVNGQTTFASLGGGVVREILEAPQRHTIMARFCNGDSQPLHNGDALTAGYWYYVSEAPVNYATQNRPVGTIFKAVGGFEGFTGGGTVTLAMDNTPFQHYEPGIKPTTNNVGNVRSGAVVRGNGDPNYVRGGLNINEFPINAKYVQIRYQIKVNNLKP